MDNISEHIDEVKSLAFDSLMYGDYGRASQLYELVSLHIYNNNREISHYALLAGITKALNGQVSSARSNLGEAARYSDSPEDRRLIKKLSYRALNPGFDFHSNPGRSDDYLL